MKRLFETLGRINKALAALTMVLLGVLVLLVAADVLVRSVGLRPLAWASSAAEYILLYATFLPMPALVRGKGHVFVEFIRSTMPPPLKRVCELAVYAACLAICAYLAGIAVVHLLNALRSGAYETRTFDMPLWLVMLPMALGLGLSTLEWLRFLCGHGSMYDINPLERDGY